MEASPEQKRLLQHLEGIAARQFGHELLLETLFSLVLASIPAAGRGVLLDRVGDAARQRFGPGAVAPSTEESAAITARTSAQALFNVENFIDKLRKDSQAR